MILGIDPGPQQSAWVVYADGVVNHGIDRNEALIAKIRQYDLWQSCVIEQIRSYGMAVGAEVFDTCVWSGRFCEAFGADRVHWLPRKDVKLNLCGNLRAKDANIRQALIDRFGGKEIAIGKKKTPGPLWGIHADEWAALAVAVTWSDRQAVRL